MYKKKQKSGKTTNLRIFASQNCKCAYQYLSLCRAKVGYRHVDGCRQCIQEPVKLHSTSMRRIHNTDGSRTQSITDKRGRGRADEEGLQV